MIRRAVLCALLLSSAATARAQVNFYLNDCGQGTTLANTVTNDCTTNTGIAFTAYASMVMPAVTKAGFIGSRGVLKVQTKDTGAINDWWRADTCRPTGFVLAADATMGGSCPTLWDTHPGAGANLSAVYGAVNDPLNRITFYLGQVLGSADAYDLTGDGVTELSVFRLSVMNAKTVGSPSCAGCATAACLVLTEIDLEGLQDTPQTFLRLTEPLVNDWISYNGYEAGPCPSNVPARNRTWGAIKALYR